MSYQHICYTNPKFHKAGHSYITLTFPKQLNAVQILHYIHLDKALKSPNLPKILVPPPKYNESQIYPATEKCFPNKQTPKG